MGLFTVILLAIIGWFLVKYYLKMISSKRSVEFGKECRHIAIKELGVPVESYNRIVVSQMEQVRDFAKMLGEVEVLEGERNPHIKESWSRRMAFAIYYIHEDLQSAQNVHDVMIKRINSIEPIVKPQVETLKRAGDFIHVGEIVYAYIASLALSLEKGSVDIEQTREIVKHMFPEKDYEFSISNAYDVACRDVKYAEKIAALMPIAGKEIREGGGDYLVRYIRWANKEIEDLHNNGEDFDPRKVDTFAFAKI